MVQWCEVNDAHKKVFVNWSISTTSLCIDVATKLNAAKENFIVLCFESELLFIDGKGILCRVPIVSILGGMVAAITVVPWSTEDNAVASNKSASAGTEIDPILSLGNTRVMFLFSLRNGGYSILIGVRSCASPDSGCTFAAERVLELKHYPPTYSDSISLHSVPIIPFSKRMTVLKVDSSDWKSIISGKAVCGVSGVNVAAPSRVTLALMGFHPDFGSQFLLLQYSEYDICTGLSLQFIYLSTGLYFL
jgi:hypothetical protein